MPELLSVPQAMRFNRHIVLPQIDLTGQEALKNSRVLIVGVGGLGCAAANSLCASGVGLLTLVDADTISTTNLQRQTLFDESQVGQTKVDAAKQRLSAINADCKIEAVNCEVQDADLHTLLLDHHIVLDCTDNAESRDFINKISVDTGIPLVSGAAIRFEGQLFVSIPGKSACYACLRTLFDAPDLSCTEAGIFSPVVNIIGLYQAMLAMQVIMAFDNIPLNTLITFDALQHEWQQWQLPKNPHCPICSKQEE